MSVQCQICQKVFAKQITNSHLKTHQLTTLQYKEMFGNDSLSSLEYRLEKSKMTSGENNPNYNKKHSEKTKRIISQKKKGAPAHNKGQKLSEDKKKSLIEGIQRREQMYRELGFHPRTGTTVPAAVRKKISKSVSNYAQNNPEIMKQRAQKATNTKNNEGGYFDILRIKTIDTRRETLGEWGFNLLDYNKEYIEIECNDCKTITRRIAWYQCHEKMCNICFPRPSTSETEKELQLWVQTLVGNTPIIFNDKSFFGNGFEIDIFLPSLKIGIEYNGLWWHSELQGKGKRYHRTKFDKALEKDLFLIQIFEDEWKYKKDICKKRIIQKLGLSDIRYYARKCNIVEIDRATAFNFFISEHIQGKGYGDVFLSLQSCGKIVAVMSFSRLTRAKGYTKSIEGVYELNRYASIGHVVGGASRLFKSFIRNKDPDEVVSYSDLRWNTGEVYSKLGFSFVGNTEPGYWYVKGDKRYHRFALRKNKDDDPNLTEWENRQLQGWNRIWDCGHAKWVWTRE